MKWELMMDDEMTVDDLRAAALAVRRFLDGEIRIRRQLQRSQPWKQEQWRRKEQQAVEVKEQYERLLTYIACTEPAEHLEAGLQQMSLFEEGEGSDPKYVQEMGTERQRFWRGSGHPADAHRPDVGRNLAEKERRVHAGTHA